MKRTMLRAGAISAAVLTIPSVALAADLKPELAGHETVRAQMREAGRDAARERRELQRRRDARARERSYARVAVPPALAAIAACESGGNPRAIGGGGLYRGKYQFDLGTWSAVGGTGDPAAASEAEQDMRAVMLYQRAGSTPWPVCG